MEFIVMVICLIVILILILTLFFIISKKNYELLLVKIDESLKNIDFFLNKKEELLFNSIDIIKNSNKKKYSKKDILNDLIKNKNIKLDMYDKDKNLKTYLRELQDLIEDDDKLSKVKDLKDLLFNLKDVENDLNASKKYYNKTVNDINNYFGKFPKSFLKGILGYKSLEKFNTKKEIIFEILKEEKKA